MRGGVAPIPSMISSSVGSGLRSAGPATSAVGVRAALGASSKTNSVENAEFAVSGQAFNSQDFAALGFHSRTRQEATWPFK